MSNFRQVIEQCQEAGGAGSKQVIQAALGSADPVARELITYALDPYITFGLKQYDMPDVFAKTMDSQHNFKPFFALLEDLGSRKLSGDAAREAVTKALIPFNRPTQEMLARVLDKDLRAGFSADSANKAWKSNPIPGDMGRKLIPTFEVMLADKCEDMADFDKYVTFPCQGDWKYDGQRTIAIVRLGQQVEYRARSGKPMDHLIGTYDADLAVLREKLGYDFVMDGESFASNFTETINAKKEGNQEAKNALRLRAFFLMPLTDWIAQKTKITMKQNREALIKLLAKCKRIEVSKGREVKDFQDMTEYCNHVIDVEKQEGLILKELNAVYTWDRSMSWCKVKRFYDVDCKIVGFYKGKPKTVNANRLGGIKVWGRLEDGTIVETDCGSGFSHAQRDEIWANQADWLGATVVIKYQEVSKSKSKTVASLRFPTFEHRRDDKVVE
jgi:DNA ligase 1